MKTLTICTILLILFISCSNENETANLDRAIYYPDATLERKTGLYPENPTNIYDSAGQLHNDISESYLASGYTSSTTSDIITQVENLANSNSDFKSLLLVNYESPTSNRIDYILANEQPSVLEIISNSKLTLSAKLSLNTFLNSLMTYRDQNADYDTIIYPFIIDYETGVIADSIFTSIDKKIILTSTSISRYAFYFAKTHRRRPRDRDWEVMWTNIVAGTEGSDNSTAKAIVMSAVCGIISNK